MFGAENVVVELTDHGDPLDSERNDAARRAGRPPRVWTWSPPTTCTTPPRPGAGSPTALAAVRARRSLDEMDGWLPPAATAHLRSGEEMARVFARYPGAVARAAQLGAECAFDLNLVAPKLPDCEVPAGHTEMS